ncbi:DUF4129 domain-containing protein [Mycolicibacterium sp. 120270]|uniref:DUF4129 domain-containing protein n=1 Tax=Mycolicibacterium sp. 120270 TaxID=3090600 RepID=UPI00299DA623|nr:DUF4129 domain-containing protein [Mycolicibacterium sp. 120270]MDX1885913.1 DUF4129 domain-containing protein [Mycolicibacterium sp. 120270]
MPALDIDRDAAHEAAQRELAKPIYPKPSLTERFMDWLQDLLYRIAQEGSQLPGGWFTISVLLIILAVAVVVAVRVARRTMRTDRGGEHALFDTHELTAAQHRARAELNAAQGKWAEAIRHRLRAVARQLEEDGVLDPVPGRTATELATDAGAAVPDLAGDLSQAAITFNDVTYGERPGTAAGYQLITDLDTRLRSRGPAKAGASVAPAPTGDWTAVR